MENNVYSNLNVLKQISLSSRREFNMLAKIEYDAKSSIMFLSASTVSFLLKKLIL